MTSAFFELDAPVTDMLDLVASGRYDDYSSGQSNFSPKVGFKFSPIESPVATRHLLGGLPHPELQRGLWPAVHRLRDPPVDCTTYAAWCASHNNNAYATSPYSLGLTQIGKPDLDPEESKSYTLGVVWQTANNVTLTLDYWNIKVDGLIAGVTNTAEAEDQYYSNNGVVNLAGITVIPGTPDPAYPNALPILGFVQSSFTNQDTQKVSGVDFNGTVTVPIGSVDWTSSLDMSYLIQYELTRAGGRSRSLPGYAEPLQHHVLLGRSEGARQLAEHVPVQRQADGVADDLLHQRLRYGLDRLRWYQGKLRSTTHTTMDRRRPMLDGSPVTAIPMRSGTRT